MYISLCLLANIKTLTCKVSIFFTLLTLISACWVVESWPMHSITTFGTVQELFVVKFDTCLLLLELLFFGRLWHAAMS